MGHGASGLRSCQVVWLRLPQAPVLVLVPLGTRVQALASPQSRRFADVSLTLRLHTAPPLGFLHTRGHLESGTFGQVLPDPGVMRPRLESLYTSLLLACCGSRRLRLAFLPGSWLRLPQARAGSECFRALGVQALASPHSR